MAVSWKTILSIFTFVAEVAAMMAAEVFTVGGATPLVSIGIGLTGATARLGIDLTKPRLNALGTAMDFAGALLPGISGFKNPAIGSRLLINAEKEVSILTTKSKEFLAQSLNRSELLKEAEKGVSKFYWGINKTRHETKMHDLENILLEFGYKSKKYAKSAEMYSDISNNIVTGWNHGRSSLTKQLERLTGKNKETAEMLFKKLTHRNTKINHAAFDIDIKKLSVSLSEVLPKEKVNNLLKIMESSKYVKSDDLTFFANAFAKTLTPDEVMKLSEKSLEVESLVYNSAGKLTKDQIRGANFAEKIRYFGSKKFNDRVIQKIQLIDPNDLGRWPAEFTYQKAKRKYMKWLEKKEISNAAEKTLKNVAKSSNKLEQAFEKAGGKLIPRNRYLLGYKPIPGAEFGGEHLVLLVFNKINTKSIKNDPQYKNRNGHRDIFVRMTKKDMSRLSIEGVSYYWEVGRKKGWYMNRGGRRVNGKWKHSLSPEMSLFLGFMPIQPFRLIASGVSNIVENTTALAEGNYFKTYAAKLERSFTRSLVNRTARFITRVAIGGAVINKTGGNAWVGRELQRFASINLSFFEGKSSTGFLKFNGFHNSHGSRGSSYANSMLLGMATMGKSGVLRQSRKFGYGRESSSHISNLRNLKIMGRIGSTVTPNRVGGKSFYNTRGMFGVKL